MKGKESPIITITAHQVFVHLFFSFLSQPTWGLYSIFHLCYGRISLLKFVYIFWLYNIPLQIFNIWSSNKARYIQIIVYIIIKAYERRTTFRAKETLICILLPTLSSCVALSTLFCFSDPLIIWQLGGFNKSICKMSSTVPDT